MQMPELPTLRRLRTPAAAIAAAIALLIGGTALWLATGARHPPSATREAAVLLPSRTTRTAAIPLPASPERAGPPLHPIWEPGRGAVEKLLMRAGCTSVEALTSDGDGRWFADATCSGRRSAVMFTVERKLTIIAPQ